ncbi:COG1470 family protein [Leifsonia sp. Leaf264]|uniref:COG1470 family protein n=1 Tax=Leifsonia sp. Leaf264 TaxID=1736314 RepID=UPI0006F49274|nr:hypothetical protein [Leifsonia sp. Leaf264]KQO96738.1 hypothetical protein ASF30_16710 [Leifsonia sp. Leaf264]
MATTANLDPTALSVTPGSPAVYSFTVLNDSLIVESYTLQAVGPAAAWTTIEPAALTIYPGKSERAVVTVLPPRAAESIPGDIAVGIRAIANEQPEMSASAEATITLTPFSVADAELIPRISRGRGRRRVRVAVDNQGNVPLLASIAGTSSEDLGIASSTPEIEVGEGRALFVDVDLVPRKRVWKGAAIAHQFGITVIPENDQPPIELTGTYNQERVFPRWLWKALLALLLLIAALIALWFLLLKPAIEATAQDAIDGPIADASQQAEAASEQADQAATTANEAKELAGETPPPVVPVATSTRANLTIRLEVSGLGPGHESERFTVPTNSVLRITDVVLSNPQGDSGTLTVENKDVEAPIFTSGLENFRDLDFHFVTPIELTAGDELFAGMACGAPGVGAGTTPLPECSDSVLVTAQLITQR